MRKTILSALTVCVILSGSKITGLASEMPQYFTKNYKVYHSRCQGIQQKPEIQMPETQAPLPESTSFAQEVLRLVNEHRAKYGLKSLSLDNQLSNVAQAHSEDMAKNNYFSHTSLSGLSPFDRIKNAGISYKTAGENIAAGQKKPAQVVSGWMNSDGHRKNILNESFTKMGLGYATSNSGYKTYWTQIFTG